MKTPIKKTTHTSLVITWPKESKNKITVLEKGRIKLEMIEGYKVTRKEDMKLNKDFEGTLNDGLDNE